MPRTLPLLLALLAAPLCHAGSFSVLDPFAEPGCPSGVTTGCDAINPDGFGDFYRADLNFGATSGTINLYFNYGPPGQTTLAPFAATSTTVLSLADLFLYSGGSIYAIPLSSRTTSSFGNATAGTVYLLNSPAAVFNSEQVLNLPLDIDYRSGHPVWLDPSQAIVVSVGSASVLTGQVIDGKTVDFQVSINFSYAAGSPLANAMNDPALGIFTATTTGAADLVPNQASQVPEPSTWMMLSSATLLFGLLRRRSR